MLNSSRFAAVGAVLAASVGAGGSWAQAPTTAVHAVYDPVINPEDFVPQVDNKYFTLKPGTKFTYQDKKGIDRVEISVTNEVKKVMGVTTTVLRVREWRNGVLSEDTYDWYAQDKAGNVWYFGEAVDVYKDGKVAHYKGSWEAGVNGAKPGIIMPKDPQVGDMYRQEYYRAHAEDIGTVAAISKKVTIPHGTFEKCVQMRDSIPFDTTAEYKSYCPGIGFLALEEVGNWGAQAELVSISRE
jgi:hypothetical protein